MFVKKKTSTVCLNLFNSAYFFEILYFFYLKQRADCKLRWYEAWKGCFHFALPSRWTNWGKIKQTLNTVRQVESSSSCRFFSRRPTKRRKNFTTYVISYTVKNAQVYNVVSPLIKEPEKDLAL